MSSRHRWGVAGHHRPARTRPRRRTGVTLSGQSSAALGTEDERARLLAIASAILLFCTPQPRNWPPSPGPSGWRGALQVDGEELMAGRRSPCEPGPASTGRRGPAPHRRGRPDCPRPGRAGPHHPHPRAGVGGDGGPEPNRPSRSRDVAPVDSGAGGRQSGGTWAVQPRQPVLRVLRSGVDPPGRSQVRQYRPPERARSTRQSTAKGQARSGRDGAGLVRGADGSRRWATALLTGTSSDRTPEHRSFRCVPSPCRFRRAPPVSPPEPLGRTAVNLAAGTGCRMCRRSQAGGDLRHMPGFRRAGGSASGCAAGWRRSHRR
jgi:hypothetical protein